MLNIPSGVKINDYSSNAGKTKSQSDKEKATSFADIMNMTPSVNKDNTAEVNNAGEKQQVEAYDKTVDNLNDNSKKKTDNVSERKDKKIINENETTDASKNTEKSADKTNNENVDETALSKEQELINSIENAILDIIKLLKDYFNLSDEQITVELETQGIELSELLDTDKLNAFTLKLNDVSTVDMLINENLQNQISEFLDEVNNIIEQYFGSGEIDKIIADVSDKLGAIEFNNESVQNNSSENEVTNLRPNDDINIDIKNENMQKETFSEQENKDFGFKERNDNVYLNLNQAIEQVASDADFVIDNYTADTPEVQIVEQIIDNIKTNITKDTTSIEVQLNPENLGKVYINVSEKDGVMQAKIIAENEAAKNVIEASLLSLKEAFENKDLKVEAIEVMVGTYENSEQDNEQNADNESEKSTTGSRENINLNDDFEEDEISEQQKLQVEMMRMSGNKVNFSV